MQTKAGLFFCITLLVAAGCRPGATFIRPEQQVTIDRSVVDCPPNFDLKEYAHNLNVPTSLCFDQDGTMFLVEGGIGNQPIHIFGKRADESVIEIYPRKSRVPFIGSKFKIFGPVGGIAASNGKVFVSHRDVNDMGVITAFAYDGTHSTVVSEFPAQGDYGITDISIRPGDGRLFFGVGPATNSGVVGIDNWMVGWLKKHPNVCDIFPVDVKLYGLKFISHNPFAGWFGGGDTAVTAPLQAFNTNEKTRIKGSANQRANSCVYSISQTGGDVRLEAYGIRLPRGIGFLEHGCYVTNDGMEMRGTRPIKDDPDALIKLASEASFGFPDFSTDMQPISSDRFQPPTLLLKMTGYPDINQLIDFDNSNLPRKLMAPSKELLNGVFPSMSGAAKFEIIPDSATALPYRNFRSQAIVALSGDRAPFATGGTALPNGPVGYKVVSVNLSDRKVSDFIFNTRGLPASKLPRGTAAMERPCDVKMGADGSLYILDMGQCAFKDGKIRVSPRTGRIFKLIPIIEPERPTPRP